MSSYRIFDILHHQLANYPLKDAFARREDKKNWTLYSTQEIIDLADSLSMGLLNLGLQVGDKVAFIASTNRPEWHILDMASLQIGLVNVPIYPTISADEYEYILNHAEAKYLFVSDRMLLRRIIHLLPNLTHLKAVYTFDKLDEASYWRELLAESVDRERLEAIRAKISEHNLATIIYTSGTTGVPKGVMLSHKNIMSNVLDAMQMVPIQRDERAFSFLPLCHVFERILNYTYMHRGASVYFADGLERVAQHLPDIRPQYFAVVPRILEKIYEGIHRQARRLTPFQKRIFDWALKNAIDTPIDGSANWLQRIKLWFSDKLVYKKWRAAVGGRVRAVISGSAPLQPFLCRVFTNAGIPILEGYGLTETSPVLTVNPLDAIRDGTVGVRLPSVQLRIAEDGEILVQAPNVMLGYYKEPEETKLSFTEDGWLKTGDIGYFNAENYLVITDRKKELLKTSGGKYVAPAPIENKMKESPFIEQIAVVGDGEKFVSALIVPNFGELKQWCLKNSINFTSRTDVIEDVAVKKLFLDTVRQINTNFSKVEQIKKVALLDNEWTVEGGELTATLKLKRKIIYDKYDYLIKKFYN